MELSDEKFADLWAYIQEWKNPVENALKEYMPLAPTHIETEFNEATEYALFPGGKRLRPVLTLLGAEIVGGDPKDVVPTAAAVEFIHTASLIFDDLPCMDDSPERREKDSVHTRYSEGLAVLVGLGFLNASYPLVFVNHEGSPRSAIKAHAELVECIGAGGMVGGQSVDLALVAGTGETKATSYDFESVRNLKTSALMRLALRTGAILSDATYLELAALSRFSEALGDAYQISDDLIDLDEDKSMFDVEGEQTTFAIKSGRESTADRLNQTIETAKRTLIDEFDSGRARTCLIQLTDYLAERSK